MKPRTLLGWTIFAMLLLLSILSHSGGQVDEWSAIAEGRLTGMQLGSEPQANDKCCKKPFQRSCCNICQAGGVPMMCPQTSTYGTCNHDNDCTNQGALCVTSPTQHCIADQVPFEFVDFPVEKCTYDGEIQGCNPPVNGQRCRIGSVIGPETSGETVRIRKCKDGTDGPCTQGPGVKCN